MSMKGAESAQKPLRWRGSARRKEQGNSPAQFWDFYLTTAGDFYKLKKPFVGEGSLVVIRGNYRELIKPEPLCNVHVTFDRPSIVLSSILTDFDWVTNKN